MTTYPQQEQLNDFQNDCLFVDSNTYELNTANCSHIYQFPQEQQQQQPENVANPTNHPQIYQLLQEQQPENVENVNAALWGIDQPTFVDYSYISQLPQEQEMKSNGNAFEGFVDQVNENFPQYNEHSVEKIEYQTNFADCTLKQQQNQTTEYEKDYTSFSTEIL